MDLWIRSQDKRFLVPIHDTLSIFHKGIFYQGSILGIYKSEERASEVLDEMQNKIRGKFLLKPKTILKPATTKSAKEYFEDLNNIDLIAGDKNFDIVPINYTDAVIYEMPKE